MSKKPTQLKIYLYNTIKRESDSPKPTFVLLYDTAEEGRKDFDALLKEVNLGNKPYIKIGTVIFESARFEFAVLEEN